MMEVRDHKRKFGDVTKVKEEIREVWSFTWFEQFFADLRFGIRALWIQWAS